MRVLTAILFFLFAAWVLKLVHQHSPMPSSKNDIYYIWSDGYSIADGVNPYSKMDGSEMLSNKKKYSTYLPGFFLLVSGTVILGADTFEKFLAFWHPLTLLICLAGGFLLWWMLKPKNIWLAYFAAGFWLFNRWTLNVLISGQIDPLAILVFMLSLYLLERDRRKAWVLLGVSLALKQIAIFALPLYLIWAYQSQPNARAGLRESWRALLYIVLAPLIVSAPFMLWDARGFILSLLFSATRSPGGHLAVNSIDAVLGYIGLVAKIPMVVMMLFVYWMAYRRILGKYSAVLLLMLCFVNFNSILFKQYFPWFIPFVPLSFAERNLPATSNPATSSRAAHA